MTERFVSACCKGEICWCGLPAEHKVEETIFFDDPTGWTEIHWPDKPLRRLARHPLTSYICHDHFVQLMGPAAGSEAEYPCGREGNTAVPPVSRVLP